MPRKNPNPDSWFPNNEEDYVVDTYDIGDHIGDHDGNYKREEEDEEDDDDGSESSSYDDDEPGQQEPLPPKRAPKVTSKYSFAH
jgi:hypothetical protein